MKPQQQHRDELKHLSSVLARIHKSLMDFEMSKKEFLTGETLTPAAKLQLLLSDPQFLWLRSLSQLMSMIDGAIFQKEALTEELQEGLEKEVKKLFFENQKSDFFLQSGTVARLHPPLAQEIQKLKLSLKV